MCVYNLDYECSVHLLLNFWCSLNQVLMGTYRDPGKAVSQMQKALGVCPCLWIVSCQLMLCLCCSYSNVSDIIIFSSSCAHNRFTWHVGWGLKQQTAWLWLNMPTVEHLQQFQNITTCRPKDAAKFTLTLLSVFFTDKELAGDAGACRGGTPRFEPDTRTHRPL